jgi:glycosyltransferase involved in cell wall biosynthesis
MKPNLLFLSPIFPEAEGTGPARRAFASVEALAQFYHVSLLVLTSFLHASPLPPRLPRSCGRCVTIPVEPSLDFSFRLQQALVHKHPSLFTWCWRKPTDWCDQTSRRFQAAAQAYVLADFKVVHAFRLAMAPAALTLFPPGKKRAFLQLDMDDIESLTHHRIAELYRTNQKEDEARSMALKARAYGWAEKKMIPRFDRVWVCSEADKIRLKSLHADVRVWPNTVTLPPPVDRSKISSEPFRFLFIGTLGYYPNLDAIHWLCREIFPGLLLRQSCELVIAGHSPSEPLSRFLATQPGVTFRPNAPHSADVFASSHALLVPLRAGGGTRLKVLEAFAGHCPVISTRLGVEGLEVRDGQEYLEANTTSEFVAAALRLMENESLRRQLAENAFQKVKSHYTADALTEVLARALP